MTIVRAGSSTQALQSQSLEANSLQSSRFDDTEDMTFETVPGFKDRGQNEEATQCDAGLFNDPHPITLADGNIKRKRGSRTFSASTKDKVEEETTTPDIPTPNESKNSTADSRPPYGSDDSAMTVRAARSF